MYIKLEEMTKELHPSLVSCKITEDDGIHGERIIAQILTVEENYLRVILLDKNAIDILVERFRKLGIPNFYISKSYKDSNKTLALAEAC